LAHHERAKHLSRILLSFKDVFLVCFFLTIGLTGLPTWDTAAAALVLLLLVPITTMLFVVLLMRFRLRARAATLGGLVLGNNSEFGLIVGAIAISAGWLAPEWLTVIALALTMAFVLSAPINVYADRIYIHFSENLSGFERRERLPGDEDIDLGGHRVLIFGMGRVGRGAYDAMQPHAKEKIIGIDLDEAQVERNREDGRNVVLGDATNPEFWSRLVAPHREIEMILLAMPHHNANLDAAKRMRERGYQGPIVAVALFPGQEAELRENGIDEVFNIYAEAGSGAASYMRSLLEAKETRTN
jgi:hypothetical protein